MKRYPDGVEGEFFYEKNCPSHRPKWVKTAKVWSERNRRDIDYCLAQDLPTFVWAANLADIELHTSLSRKKNVGAPDDDGLRSRSRARRPTSCSAARSVSGCGKSCRDEPEKLGKNIRLERSASLRSAEHRSHLRADESACRTPLRSISSTSIRNWSSPKCRRRCAKEKSSSIGARTTSTRQPSAFTRSRAKEQPTASTPVTWEEVEQTLKKKDGKRARLPLR